MSEIVRKANALVSAAHRLTTAEQRVIWCAISKIEPMREVSDEELYRVSAADLVNAGISSKWAADVLQSATEQLFKRSVTLMASDGKEITTRWVQSIRDRSKTGDSYIELRFSKDLLPYLSNLSAQFTQYSLREAVSLGSAHAGRIFEILMQYRSIGHRTVDLAELRYMLELTDKYPAFSDFRKRVLDKSVELIESNTGMRINYETIRVGRKISRVKFNFYYPQKVLPKTALDTNAMDLMDGETIGSTLQMLTLSDKQRAFYAAKLCKNTGFLRVAKVGESEDAFKLRIENELKDPKWVQSHLPDLQAVGFSTTKQKH